MRTKKDIAPDEQTHLWRLIALSALIAIAAALFVFTWAMLDRGFEFTDEGFYLNSIARPDLYPTSVTQFGPIWHPLWAISGHDIVLLRVINYLLLVILTGWLALRALAAVGLKSSRFENIGLTSAFAISALLAYCLWLPTPNYNTLNLVGAMLFLIGALGASADRVKILDIAIAGAGLALVALAKPTTGALLAPLALAASWSSWRHALRFASGAAIVAIMLFALFLLAVRGPLDVVVRNYGEGASLTWLLPGDRHGLDVYLWRSWPFLIEWFYIAAVIVISALLHLAMNAKKVVLRWTGQGAALLLLAGACVLVESSDKAWNHPANWIPVLMALTFAGLCRSRNPERFDARAARLALIMLVVPLAVGFGSNTGMLRSAAQAAPIWTVGGILVLATVHNGEQLRATMLRVAVASVATTVIVVVWAQSDPHRERAPLWAQTTWAPAFGRDHAVRTDEVTAAYLSTLVGAANRGGFNAGTPVIDMTGGNAGAIYALGGDALGWPYLSSGWAGSKVFVERALSANSRDQLDRAWILTGPSGQDLASLAVLGLDFPESYEQVVAAEHPIFSGQQLLWRPKPRR